MNRVVPGAVVFFVGAMALLYAAPNRADTIEVKPQSLAGALREFSEQTDLQIAYVATLAKDKKSRGTKGRTEPENALSDILDGTGLKYEYVNRTTIAIGSSLKDAVLRGTPKSAPAGTPVQPILRAQSQPAASESAEQEEEAQSQDEEPLELGVYRVTGSRLAGGDPTARVYSLTADEIAARGVSTLEELLRALPWAFASLTTQTNMSGIGDAEQFGVLGLGVGAVNLRALGAANTLVLLNGRRMAGVAGIEDGFVNILNIPLASIERVDIQLGGGSAVYGSDAIGGVVNLITKQDYNGASARVRNEFSSTGSHRNEAEFVGGFAWNRGNVTVALSRNSQSPINNHKIWTSADFRDRLGPEFDQRSYQIGQPGVVQDLCGEPPWTFGCGPRMQLPAAHSGVGATIEDFTGNVAPWDQIFPHNGEDSTLTAATVNWEQHLNDRFRIHADILYSNHDAYQEFETLWASYPVPASNAFNPFGREVSVSYWPGAELETGLLRPAHTESEDSQRDATLGFTWALGSGYEWEFNATRSKSTRFVWQISPDWLNRGFFDPSRERLLQALASSDPGVALNLFGDGTAQGSGIDALLTNTVGPERGVSKVTSYESVLRGGLFRIAGAPVTYVAGGEIRKEVAYQTNTRHAPDGSLSAVTGPEANIGVEEPSRELLAYFVEFSVPIITEHNARPGLQSLVLSVQARHDRYEATGASGGVERLDFDETGEWITAGEPRLVTARQSATSPRVGLHFQPTEGLTARAEWNRSFRAPVFSDVFSVFEPTIFFVPYVDPYDPDGPMERFLPTVEAGGSNLGIDPEFSDHFSVSLELTPAALPDLHWSMQWSRIDFGNKIESSTTLLFDYPEVAFRLPSIVKRDADGRAVEVHQTKVNIAEHASETLDTRLQYAFATRWGRIAAEIGYVRVLKEYFQTAPESDPVRLRGTSRGSDAYRLTGSLNWQYQQFTADVFAYYSPGYRNELPGFCREAVGRCAFPFDLLPEIDVGSLLTVDVTMAYRFDNGLRLRAGGRNVFDREAPATLRGRLPYDATRWDARGRVVFLEANWEFGWGA